MTFRLLDERVGWDARPGDGLAGLVVAGGALALEPLGAAAPPPSVVLPPRLARAGAGWWLGSDEGILRLGPCDDGFHLWRAGGPVHALAARGKWLAALTADALLIFDTRREQLNGQARIAGTAVGITARDQVLVAEPAGVLHAFDLSGLACGSLDTGKPVAQLVGLPCRTIVVHADGTISVLEDAELTSASELGELEPTGVTAAGPNGFCLDGRGCFTWDGAPLGAAGLGPAPARYVTSGQYLSEPLDSGLPGCCWHRIRIDAQIPDGSALEAAIATTDGPGVPDPHPDDWVVLSALDVALDVPAGRRAYLRLRLLGDGSATPLVHAIRLDLPRATSLDDLPAVYSADDRAREFSERFLSLFDAELELRDELIDRRAALLDAPALPDDALGWLGGLLGIGFEAEMPVARRRALIAAAPDLFRRRGTPRGLADTLRIALGVEAVVEELGPRRPWGAVGRARLDGVRLFAPSRARVRLGTSRLGAAPLNDRGNPDDDARLAGSNRVRVHVGPGTDRALVERVVRSQTPAHVVTSVHVRLPGFVLSELRLGIDTVLIGPGPAVAGLTRLGRGVLRGDRVAVLGRPLIVGINTRTE